MGGAHAPHTTLTAHRPAPAAHTAPIRPEYHRSQPGIPDDCDMLALFLVNIGFQNEYIQYEIMRVFQQIRQGWYNQQHNSFGPQKESILKSTAISTQLLLEKFNAPSVVNWYECLTSTCKAFRIGLVPFDAIQFGRRHEGLCIPGLRLDRYRDMQSALCTALPMCLARADSRVLAMIAGIETKSQNGYKIIWNLLYRFVPGFNPTNTINKPTWDGEGGNVIKYAAAFDLYFRLSSKRGNCQHGVNKSILFLKGITARNLSKIVEPLIITIESTQNKLDNDGGYCVGYLPPYLRIDKLAQKIAEQCKVEPFDQDLGGRPRVHNFSYEMDATSPASDSEDNTERYAEPINGHMQGYLVPTIGQACWPNGLPGRRMPNTTYTRKPDPAR
jgi:hypothetical protein